MCDLEAVRESLAVAEAVARAAALTSPSARRQLAARTARLQCGHLDRESGEFVPSRQVLLYLARMGSLVSSARIPNGDDQDRDLVLPAMLGRLELLQHCRQQAPTAYPLLRRAFRRASAPPESIHYRRLNALSKGCSDYISNPQCLRVFQWNILSQSLGQMNDNFVRCPDEALEWNYRKFRIVEEIMEYNPDIICLQEVDHFNFLSQVLGTQGYSGTFFPKPDSPCFYIDGNNGPDGCAIFYRTDKFQPLTTETRILEIWRVQSNQVALVVVLRVRETGQEVCVATTHLKARNGALLATLRNEQGKDLLNFLQTYAQDRPLVLCGDFNAEPVEPVYDTVLSHQQLGLSSAYADSHPNGRTEPPYTTWKIREEGEVCHTIDYVFYSKSKLQLEAVLDMPDDKEMGPDRVPSMRYPSDHFALCCDFRIPPPIPDSSRL